MQNDIANVLARPQVALLHTYVQHKVVIKAFDVLERLDPDPEFWEGKRGAAIGVFQMVVAGKESKERLIEVI